MPYRSSPVHRGDLASLIERYPLLPSCTGGRFSAPSACLWWSWVTPGSAKARIEGHLEGEWPQAGGVEGEWQRRVVGRPVRA